MACDIIKTLNSSPEPSYAKARAVRGRIWGKQVFIRGIIEFSNHCAQNCLYCGLRRDNQGLTRYRLNFDEIMRQARLIKGLGIGTVVLQSGEDLNFSREFISSLIKEIKNTLGLAITLSVGERPQSHLKSWLKAGAERYLLKMETFNQPLYEQMRPGCRPATRLGALRHLQDMGYETGTGLINGLPGQNAHLLAEDLQKLADLKLDMTSISPFCPHPATPLAGARPGTVEENLLALSIARITNPTTHIPATSALCLYGDNVRNQALSIADVLMFSFTPKDVRGAYNIYPGKNSSPLSPSVRAAAIMRELKDHGFTIASGPGPAWRKENLK